MFTKQYIFPILKKESVIKKEKKKYIFYDLLTTHINLVLEMYFITEYLDNFFFSLKSSFCSHLPLMLCLFSIQCGCRNGCVLSTHSLFCGRKTINPINKHKLNLSLNSSPCMGRSYCNS